MFLLFYHAHGALSTARSATFCPDERNQGKFPDKFVHLFLTFSGAACKMYYGMVYAAPVCTWGACVSLITGAYAGGLGLYVPCDVYFA